MTIQEWVAISGLLIGVTGAILTVYVKLMTKIKELDIRILAVEKQDERVMNKLDRISEDLSDIKIELQNKQNRLN